MVGYRTANVLGDGQGMANWNPAQWQVWFMAAGSFVSLALTPLVIAWWKGKNDAKRLSIVEKNQKAIAQVASPNVIPTDEATKKVDEIAKQ